MSLFWIRKPRGSLSHDELTQIAAARVENGEIVDWFVTFVNPGKPIPEDVAHLTDIHDEDVADAPLGVEALADLAAFVGDAVVVAHNAEFDRNFDEASDGLSAAREYLDRFPRFVPHRAAPHEIPSTHRSREGFSVLLGQRIGLMKMWRRPVPLLRILLAAVEAMPTMLLREIASMAEPNDWPTVVVFKYFAERAAETSEEKPLPFSCAPCVENVWKNRSKTARGCR